MQKRRKIIKERKQRRKGGKQRKRCAKKNLFKEKVEKRKESELKKIEKVNDTMERRQKLKYDSLIPQDDPQ